MKTNREEVILFFKSRFTNPDNSFVQTLVELLKNAPESVIEYYKKEWKL